MENINIYELYYRNFKVFNNALLHEPEAKLEISVDTEKQVWEIIKKFEHVKANNDTDKIKFSDVIYKPLIINSTKQNINESINRFRNLKIDELPLIDVAKLLKINVEKSNRIDAFGEYRYHANKIIMGTDYGPTFIHELVHAVDHKLPNYVSEKNYGELVAEFSNVILCKIYSVSINESYSKYYLDGYTTKDINGNDLVKRVMEIIDYVKKL